MENRSIPTRSEGNTIEKLSQVCLIATCVAVLGNIAYTRFAKAVPNSRVAIQPSKVARVSPLPRVSGRALLAFLQPGCKYCEASMPFYRELQNQRMSQTSLVYVTMGDESTMKSYLSGYSLGANSTMVSHARFRDYGVGITPTLELIDEHGNVLGQWVGQLGKNQEEEVKRMVLAK